MKEKYVSVEARVAKMSEVDCRKEFEELHMLYGCQKLARTNDIEKKGKQQKIDFPLCLTGGEEAF